MSLTSSFSQLLQAVCLLPTNQHFLGSWAGASNFTFVRSDNTPCESEQLILCLLFKTHHCVKCCQCSKDFIVECINQSILVCTKSLERRWLCWSALNNGLHLSCVTVSRRCTALSKYARLHHMPRGLVCFLSFAFSQQAEYFEHALCLKKDQTKVSAKHWSGFVVTRSRFTNRLLNNC